MNIRRIGTAASIIALLTAFVLPAALVITPAHAPATNTFRNCDVVAGIGDGQYNWLRPDVCPGVPSSLTLQATLLTGDGSTFTTGAAFDTASCNSAGVVGGIPNPNPGVPCLYGTAFTTGTVFVWDNTGALLGTCAAPGAFASGVESVNVVPGAGGVAPALVIGDVGSTSIYTTPLPCTAASTATTHGPITTDGTGGTDWVDTQADKCNVNVDSEGTTIQSFNACTNVQNANTATGLPGTHAFALKTTSATGTIVADGSLVDSVGVNTCDSASPGTGGLFSMDINPGGSEFAVGSFANNKIDYITTAHCNAGQTTPDATFDSVVGLPTSGLFGLAIFGEITAVTTTPELGAPMMLVAAVAMMGVALVARRKFAVPTFA